MIGFLKKLVKKVSDTAVRLIQTISATFSALILVISATFLEIIKGHRAIVRAITAAGAAFLALGLVGVAVFGYLVFKNGGMTGLIGMADGIGLIVSLVVLISGFYMK